jgi:hypothetical protein
MSAFFTGALALFIMMTFLFILQTIIDPALIEVQKEVGLDSAIGLAEFISGEELSDDAIQEIQNEVERTSTTPTLGLTLLGYVLFTAFGAIPAIIIALFVRKEEDPLEKLKREQA